MFLVVYLFIVHRILSHLVEPDPHQNKVIEEI